MTGDIVKREKVVQATHLKDREMMLGHSTIPAYITLMTQTSFAVSMSSALILRVSMLSFQASCFSINLYY
jgi:hypothetical protein